MDENKTEAELVAEKDAEMEKLGLKPAEPEVVEPTETTQEDEPEVAPEPEKVEPEAKPKPDEVAEREPTPKDFKAYKQELRTELQADFDKKLEEFKQEALKTAPKTEILEDEVVALAKELDFDPAKTRRLIEVARKGIELTPEDKKALEDFKSQEATRKEQAEEAEQKQIFETEWTSVLPSLQKEYPNASPEQIATVKAQLDELSHSEKYHEAEMDYILFKERETIGKALFSPKKSTFESARLAPIDTDTDEWPEITADMTPNQILAAEKRREAITDGLGRDKIRITTRDDRGRIIEREE